jgi:hypothetical protein
MEEFNGFIRENLAPITAYFDKVGNGASSSSTSTTSTTTSTSEFRENAATLAKSDELHLQRLHSFMVGHREAIETSVLESSVEARDQFASMMNQMGELEEYVVVDHSRLHACIARYLVTNQSVIDW